MIDYPTMLEYRFPLSKNGYNGTVEIRFFINNGCSMNIPIDKEQIIKYVDIASENIKKNFS